MEKKFVMELSVNNNFIGPQFVCFPIAAIMGEKKFHNWYYVNYMLPIIMLDGPTCLTCTIDDSFVYGSDSNVYSKIMRINSVNVEFCEQIEDINEVLRKEIFKEYYCVLFLDFNELSCFQQYYHKKHYIHEILFYGYDDEVKRYKCYGYLDNLYQCFEITYDEVKKSFGDAIKHIRNGSGWQEYMFITMDLVAHDKEYPYRNDYFIEKLEEYIKGKMPYTLYYGHRLYMIESKESRIAFGVNIVEVLIQYLNMLQVMTHNGTIYDQFANQQPAINMLWSFYEGMEKRLSYFVEKNGLEKILEKYVIDYRIEVVRRSKMIRMLYIKLVGKVVMGQVLDNVLVSIMDNLVEIKRREKEILIGYLTSVSNLDVTEEVW